MEKNSADFVMLLTAHQSSLYACILALLPDHAAAKDILQETNLTLWQKAADFEKGTNFLAWATRIARYHIMNYRRSGQRARVVFDDDLFQDLSARQLNRIADFDGREDALRVCVEKLKPEHRELVRQRYEQGHLVQDIAERTHRSVGAISQTLFRIRETLLNCIQSSLFLES